MVPTHITALTVPEYRPDIRLTRFGGILQRARILQSTYISVHRVNCLAEIHIGCQQPHAEVTQTLGEDTEYHDASYGRLLGWETRLLVALLS